MLLPYLSGSKITCIDVDVKIFQILFSKLYKDYSTWLVLHFLVIIPVVSEKNSLTGIWVGSTDEHHSYIKYSKRYSNADFLAMTVSANDWIQSNFAVKNLPGSWIHG